MCLAVPMQVRTIDGFEARCVARGVERTVSLYLLQNEPVHVGDWVLVHVGYALQRMSADEARRTWDLFDQMLDRDDLVA
ncbi:MAG: HypC/HybG/HupF family hydrogenase formation chaperone [Geminicoccaceae bacterium]